MKAIICNQFGQPNTLQYQEVAPPSPKEDKILISVKACSVNFPDTLIIQGKYQFRPPFPFSPGSDVAGIVLQVGKQRSPFKVGSYSEEKKPFYDLMIETDPKDYFQYVMHVINYLKIFNKN